MMGLISYLKGNLISADVAPIDLRLLCRRSTERGSLVCSLEDDIKTFLDEYRQPSIRLLVMNPIRII